MRETVKENGNGAADDRPRLPRREPQQNLVTELQVDPDEEGLDSASAGEGTAQTLTAFAKGTRRGRDGTEES